MLTRKQIQEKMGISFSMFEFYRRLDLIPGPVKTIRFKGKGSASYYDEKVIRDINTIKDLQKQGWALKDMKDLLSKKKSSTGSHISEALRLARRETEKELERITWRIVKKQLSVNKKTGKKILKLEIQEE